MGPVMNIVLAVVVLAVVLAQGAEVPAYQDEPPVVGAVAAGSPAEQAGIAARRPHPHASPATRCETWDDLFIAVGTRPNRDVTIDAAARRTRPRSIDGAPARRERGSRSATSACCRTSHPIVESVSAGRPGRQGRA